MPSNEILHSFRKIGIIPVVVLNKTEDALPLGEALCEGGLPTAEITFRTDAAEDSIRRMVHTFPDMLIGAGTVLNTEQVDRAIDAGAKFIVSPGLNLTVVKYCKEKNITVIPGSPEAESGIEQITGVTIPTLCCSLRCVYLTPRPR